MAKKARGISNLRTYNWKDHDPAIDVARTARDDANISVEEACNKSGVARATVYGWESGRVKSPMHKTLAAHVIALGASGIGYDQGGNPYLIWRHGPPTKKRRG